MDITKCDKCKKVKGEKDRANWMHLSAFGGDFSYKSFDFCEKCGDKIARKLKNVLRLSNEKTERK